MLMGVVLRKGERTKLSWGEKKKNKTKPTNQPKKTDGGDVAAEQLTNFGG